MEAQAQALCEPGLPRLRTPLLASRPVDGPLLTLLTAIIAALAGLGVLGTAWPRLARDAVAYATALLAGLAALLSLVALSLNDAPASLLLPLGPPGAPFRLALDPLAALFATLTFAAGAAISAFAAAARPALTTTEEPPAAIAPLPVCLAGLGLAVLAADSLGRGTGLALAGVALWAMGTPTRAAAGQLAIALLAAAAVIAASEVPPPALLAAAIVGPGALAGLLPWHTWRGTPQRPTQTPLAAALLSGGMVPVATYALLRLLFDPAGTAPPLWWGLPFLALGAAAVVAGGLDATRREDIDTALAGGTTRQTGLTAIGLGIALSARAADLPGVTAMALGAVLLLSVLQTLGGTLLALAGGAIHQGAGTRRLDRLGGLVHRMPVTTTCLLAGLFAESALPPGAGFAAIWLLFQALLALPRAGNLPFQLLLCALAAVLGLAAAVSSAGLLRLVGVACLGRPRTPRAAVADEPTRPARRTLLALAATTVLLGVFVGPLLRLLANSPVVALTGTGLGPRASMLGLASGAESPGYAALPLASLLLLVAGVVLWLRRRAGVQGDTARGPAWDDGFAAPPQWLPFGNPLTQASGAGFAPIPAWRTWPLVRHLARLRGVTPTPPSDNDPGLLGRAAAFPAPAVALILAAVLLALCAWAGTT